MGKLSCFIFPGEDYDWPEGPVPCPNLRDFFVWWQWAPQCDI